MKPDGIVNHDWPVDAMFTQQPFGRLRVSGLIGPIYKFVLMPTYAPDDKGVLRVVSWSFVPRENVLKPEMIEQLEKREKELDK